MWHILMHLATHAGRHLFGDHGKKTDPDACVRCSGKTDTMYITHCCSVRLCSGCQSAWSSESNRNARTCVICKKPLVVK
jgi:hypothetical protein